MFCILFNIYYILFFHLCRHPLGVAALISPWNLPLYLLSFKIAPAIMAGELGFVDNLQSSSRAPDQSV